AADELLRKGAAIYKETNCKLRVITSRLSNLLEKTGYKAISVPKSKIMNDEKFISLHKLAADLANIGKIEGSLLVTPEVGVGVNWGTVLTDAILF
ncbi:MAG: 4Fe-4S ferredoxin, partial [Methanobacterium sp.]